MRIVAFLAALAGLTAIIAQGFRFAGASGVEAIAKYAAIIVQVSQWSQLAFILLVTLFLFVFALSKREAASSES
jgi:hypothetical protein